ncbi:hypothetical protein [Rhodococcus wratislaviensis]|uniref:hypothetical protein n=1 Tax=Rhodococcus wratislaviensis TaxID=44752 RepID=UPI003908A476
MFGVDELERTTDPVEHCFGHAGGVPAFEADVVLDSHLGEQRDFLASQSRNPAATAEVR